MATVEEAVGYVRRINRYLSSFMQWSHFVLLVSTEEVGFGSFGLAMSFLNRYWSVIRNLESKLSRLSIVPYLTFNPHDELHFISVISNIYCTSRIHFLLGRRIHWQAAADSFSVITTPETKFVSSWRCCIQDTMSCELL